MTPPSVYVNLSVPKRAVDAAAAGVDGVGLMRSEFLVYRTGRHPMLLLKDTPPADLVTILEDAMCTVARAMYPRPVTYRSLDLRSNELRNLLGGVDLEAVEENPSLGCRGMARARRDPEPFAAELEALKNARAAGFDNINLMLPFVRWPEEVIWARECMKTVGLSGKNAPLLWMMVETPAVILRSRDFAGLVDGVSIGSNDLTQLILGLDRDNYAFGSQNWDDDPAVIDGIHWAVDSFKELGVPVGICGDAPSRSNLLLESLYDWGLDSISVSLDRVGALQELLSQREAVGA